MFDDLLSPSAVRSLAQGRLSGPLEVVPFGIPRLDQSIGYWGGRKGVPFGEYGIIGGASSSGKTQFGLHILNQASMAGVSSGMISLEMTREDIMLRLAQSWTPSIDATRWEPGRWRQEVEARELLSSQADVREKFRAPVWVNDKASGDLYDRHISLAKVMASMPPVISTLPTLSMWIVLLIGGPEVQGGTIWVEEAAMGGACFRVILPDARDAELPVDTPASAEG